MIEEFASLSKKINNVHLQIEACQKQYIMLLEERKQLVKNNNWEMGVHDVPGGHVVIDHSENITFHPEKT